MTDDRSRGVHLTDKQLVFVFMAATVVAVVVFLCGVLVGRGVQAARGEVADGTMLTPPQVVSDGTTDAAATDPPAADKGGRGSTDLSYAERLGKTPPPEQLKPPPPETKTAAAAPDPALPPEVSEDAGGAPAADAGSGDFTVQVAAVKKRSEADAIVKQLKARGYAAFVFVPEDDTLGVFRVRIGAFKTRREADNIARRIEREERYKPWVTR
jgi:cell division septation protein DedD